MKHSLNDGAGNLIIDHSNSPGMEGVALPAGAVTAAPGEKLERDTKTCRHCQRLVVLNVGRVRARAVCHKCYSYICDECEKVRAATGQCVPFMLMMDRAETIIERYSGQPDHPNASFDLTDVSGPSAPTITVPKSITLTDPL